MQKGPILAFSPHHIIEMASERNVEESGSTSRPNDGATDRHDRLALYSHIGIIDDASHSGSLEELFIALGRTG